MTADAKRKRLDRSLQRIERKLSNHERVSSLEILSDWDHSG